jgi:hypothetical protein
MLNKPNPTDAKVKEENGTKLIIRILYPINHLRRCRLKLGYGSTYP